MTSAFQRFVDSQTLYYQAFARLPLRSRLKAALGSTLMMAAALTLVYLIFRPYLYTSGAAGTNVLVAFAVLFALLVLLCAPPMVFPGVAEYRHTITVVSLLLGTALGVLWGAAAEAEPIPLWGATLFKMEPEGITTLLFLGAMAAIAASSILVGGRMAEIQRESTRMETELKLAQNIQERLLPAVHRRADDYAVYGTAGLASEVGGDFFDVVEPEAGDETLVVTVGDVAGHNVAAGLMMATAKGAFHGALGPRRPALVSADTSSGNGVTEHAPVSDALERARKMLETMNRTVYAHAGRRHFVSCQVGFFDFAGGHLVLGNAGHVPLLHWRRERGVVEQVAPRGTALGLLPAGTAGVEAVSFAPGDTFLFYTDGLLEARDATGAEFGLDRTRELLTAEAPGTNPEALCERFSDALAAHTGGEAPSDDVTLLAVRIG